MGDSLSVNANALWISIKNFDFDGGPSEFTFADRLARDNRWSKKYALRAIEEYRRFVFLAMVAGHPVTPSQIVDEVWHLHLLYTDSYWNRLVGQVLPRPLHHHPTRGSQQEKQKLADQYSRTLRSYAEFFREPPPPDVWRIQLLKSLPQPSPRSHRMRLAIQIGAASVALATIAAGCAPDIGPIALSKATLLMIIGGAGVVVIGVLLALARGTFSEGAANFGSSHDPERDRKDASSSGGCSTHQNYSGDGSVTESVHHEPNDGSGDGGNSSDGSASCSGSCGGGCSS